MWGAKQGGANAQIVPLGGGGVLTALKGKQVDAAVLWPNLSYKAMIEDGARPLGDLGALMEPNLPESWVAAQDMIDKRPEALRAFLQAVMKSADHMKKDEAFSVAFVKKYSGDTDDRVAKMAYDTVVKNFSTDGVIKPEWIKNSIALAALAGPTADLPKIEDIYTDKFFPVKFD
jgi:ABC-type nitrate/sulfonate/bicarbonate transport system substrate-binding protein